MINIGKLLDACGIPYTDKQLSKLDHLLNKLLKKLSLQQLDSNETTPHDSTSDYLPDSEDKSRNEDFAIETKLKSMEEFNFKHEPYYNNTIKEEIQEDIVTEIKEEHLIDPFASLETFDDSEGKDSNEHFESVHESEDRCKSGDLELKMEMNSETLVSSNITKRNTWSLLLTVHEDFKCNDCNAAFSQKRSLNRHTEAVHKGKKQFECAICDASFSRKETLNRHNNSVHEGKKLFKCKICDASFSLKANLKSHIESVHEEIKSFQCNICDSAFYAKGKLNRHIASVHEGKKPYKCNECDTAFAEKGKLNGHIESVHERKKPFHCNICDSSFSQKGDMNRHIESVHEGKKLFSCKICYASFSLKGNLKSHIESVHEEEKSLKFFRCSLPSCNYYAPNGFHGFPKNEKMRKKWQKLCDMKEVKKCDRLCFHHFEESQLIVPKTLNSQPRLKLGALPSLNISLESFKKGFSDILHEGNEEIIHNFPITEEKA